MRRPEAMIHPLRAILIAVAVLAPAVASACHDHKRSTTCTSNTSITGTTRTVCR